MDIFGSSVTVNNDTTSEILTDYDKDQTPQIINREYYIKRQQGNFKKGLIVKLLLNVIKLTKHNAYQANTLIRVIKIL